MSDKARTTRRQTWKKGEVRSRLHTKRRLAQEAGLSLHAMRQALRLAAIPAEEFDRLVESPDGPPPLQALVALGTRRHTGRVTTPDRGATTVMQEIGRAVSAYLGRPDADRPALVAGLRDMAAIIDAGADLPR